MIDLSGTWRLHCAARHITVDYPVPGDVHSALISAGQIPHPYKGKNELACRWVADEEWVATREFEVVTEQGGQYFLDLDYLDTVATVRVNGIEVLQAENCFRRYRPDITKAIRFGKNVLEVVLHSNTKAANEKQAAQPFYIPYSKSNNLIPNGNMLRKPQCHFGWDWNLAVVPFGICGNITLERLITARIDALMVHQIHNADGTVDVSVTVHLHSNDGGKAECIFDFAGETRMVSVDCVAGQNALTEVFHLASPILWWPSSMGAQHLYLLEVSCDGEGHERMIGIRNMELLTTPEQKGSRFALVINGREMFCKGANWIPADALPSNATPQLTRKLLQAAKDANMNMIRVWGGGYYEKDFFYDICDELGLLVWQDFMFSCSLYPSTPDFLEEVKAEASYQVSRLQHHACIAIWCGDNELIGALTWFEESRKNRDRYLVNYDRLNRTLEETVKQTDRNAIWWPSSPSPGILDFGDTWHDDSKGDMHFWSVWHEGRDFEHYYDVKPRFCSEFGFQSFPSLHLIKEFSEGPQDLNISSSVMEHHQRNAGGNARIAETMFRNFRFPMGFGNFVYLSQVQHGLAMKMAVEYWRSLKPHCMGTLYWQLNDTWPVASWSGLDHGGSWKLMHHMAKRFYAPVLVTARKAGDTFIVSAVHELPNDFTTTIEIQSVTMDGKVTTLHSQHMALTGTGEEIIRLDARALGNAAILMVQWSDENGHPRRSHATPVPYKHLSLPAPELTVTTTASKAVLNIKITAKRLALYVALECDVVGHFSDNAFDLLGGESVTIIFTPDTPSELARAAATLVVRDIHSSSHTTH